MGALLEKILLIFGPLLREILAQLRIGTPKAGVSTKKAIKKAVEDGDTSDLEDDFRNTDS